MPVGPIDYSQTLDCLLAIAYCLLAPHCQLPRLTGSQPGRLLPFAYCQLTIACLPHYLLFNSLSTVNCPLPIYSPCLLFNSLSTVNCPLPIYSPAYFFNFLSTVNCPLPIYSTCLLFQQLVNCQLPCLTGSSRQAFAYLFTLPTFSTTCQLSIAHCLFIHPLPTFICVHQSLAYCQLPIAY